MSQMLGSWVKVIVDRPLGSTHPQYQDLIYSVNYGYIEGTMAPDGEEQDAYILGIEVPLKEFAGKVITVIHRHNDIEEKWVVVSERVYFSKEKIQELTYFQEQYFHSEIVMEEAE